MVSEPRTYKSYWRAKTPVYLWWNSMAYVSFGYVLGDLLFGVLL